MVQAITNITLDTIRQDISPKVLAKQHDAGSRYICATIQTNGQAFEFGEIRPPTVKLNAKRADGQTNSFNGTIQADDSVLLPIDAWMLTLDDVVECEVLIETGGIKLRTISFVVDVAASIEISQSKI